MTVTLNQTQRLNLGVIVGNQKCNLADTLLLGRVLERIELSPEERQQINYVTREVNGQQSATWSIMPVLEREYEFSSDEAQRVVKVLRDWPQGYFTTDLKWLMPLLTQLENGQPK
jgi:hypothetical protein